MNTAVYIAIMAGTTYLIRVIPFTAFQGKIKSRYIKSLLYYMPYAVLSAMTLPAVFFCTGSVTSASAGTAVAVLLAYLRLPLIVVAVAASAAVFLTQLLVPV